MYQYPTNGLFTKEDYLAQKNTHNTHNTHNTQIHNTQIHNTHTHTQLQPSAWNPDPDLDAMISHHHQSLAESQRKKMVEYKKFYPFMEIRFSESESGRCDKMEIWKSRVSDDLSTEWVMIRDSGSGFADMLVPFQQIADGSMDHLLVSPSEENEEVDWINYQSLDHHLLSVSGRYEDLDDTRYMWMGMKKNQRVEKTHSILAKARGRRIRIKISASNHGSVSDHHNPSPQIHPVNHGFTRRRIHILSP
jgi:hypothetical protein